MIRRVTRDGKRYLGPLHHSTLQYFEQDEFRAAWVCNIHRLEVPGDISIPSNNVKENAQPLDVMLG